MPWKNKIGMKQDNQSYEDRYYEVEGDTFCNLKKREPYLDIDYEELQIFNFVQSDEEFSTINPNFLDLNLVGTDSLSNAPVVSAIIDNLLLPNEQLYEVCSQLNKSQKHLFGFKMYYTLHCKLVEKKNELPLKIPFLIF